MDQGFVLAGSFILLSGRDDRVIFVDDGSLLRVIRGRVPPAATGQLATPPQQA